MKNVFKNLLTIMLVFFTLQSCSEKPKEMDNIISLKFNENGKFKIVQFTDIHWKNGSEQCDSTIMILEKVLDTEKPDLVVFTGDIAYSEPQKEGWNSIAAPIIERQIPWALVLGNHDEEFDMEREDIIPYLQKMPCFVGSKGPENIAGYSNYILPIKSSKTDSAAANLYFFDSNAYVKDKKNGYYDWIKLDQIQWYLEQSQKIKNQNQGYTLPALAFFHIPLPEYDELYQSGNYIGRKREDVCSPKINSGLYAAFLENKEVMGVFVGHDHDNDYVGNLRDIVLAYGRVSGLDAYGAFERGGRIIELTEGDFKFDTWIRTATNTEMMYYYPNNELYPNDSTVFMPAAEIELKENGVTYKYFEGQFSMVNDIVNKSPKEQGKTNNISIDSAKVEDHFAYEFDSYIEIPENGLYKFKLSSDDGAVVYIDEKEIVNNDGSHSLSSKEGIVGLERGFHKIKVLYFEDYMGNELKLGIVGLSINYDQITDNMFYN